MTRARKEIITKHVIQSLPKLIEKATSRDLSKGLKDHLEETKNQIDRRKQVFQKLGKQLKGVQSQAIDGLIVEAHEIVGEGRTQMFSMRPSSDQRRRSNTTRLRGYGTLIAWAREFKLGMFVLSRWRNSQDHDCRTYISYWAREALDD